MDNQTTIKKETHFWELNNNLMGLGATYFSLLIFNAKNELTFSKSSDSEWSYEFSTTGLYKKCHLISAAHELLNLSENSFMLAWDLYLPNTDEAKELDDIRKLRDITHGVGFCIKNPDQSRVMINLAGKYSDVNFGLNMIRKRSDVYKDIHAFITNQY